MNFITKKTINFGLILFLLLSFYSIFQDIKNDKNKKDAILLLQNQVTHIRHNSKHILELQRERGLTNIYFANPSQKNLLILQQQRKETLFHANKKDKELQASLNAIRHLVDTHQSQPSKIFYQYSELVSALMLNTKSIMFEAKDKTLKNELVIYDDLHLLQEIWGQQRATVGVALATQKLTKELKEEIQKKNVLFFKQLENTFRNDLIMSRKYTRKISMLEKKFAYL